MKIDNATDNTTTTLTNHKADLLKHLRSQAQQAHTTPVYSGFHVPTAGLTKHKDHYKAFQEGNHEAPGHRTTTHGEEAVLAATLTEHGHESPLEHLWFYQPRQQTEQILTPCGGCRDQLRHHMRHSPSEDIAIYQGVSDERPSIPRPPDHQKTRYRAKTGRLCER